MGVHSHTVFKILTGKLLRVVAVLYSLTVSTKSANFEMAVDAIILVL